MNNFMTQLNFWKNRTTHATHKLVSQFIPAFLLFAFCASANALPEGTITTVAGNGNAGFTGDGGSAVSASLNSPLRIVRDQSGNLYFSDLINQRIRKISAATGIISTIAGNGVAGFTGDGGPAISASLNYPAGLTLDSVGNIYFAEHISHRVRKINASTGIITTVAGNGTGAFQGDGGLATSASLTLPNGVVFDSTGNLYITDYGNQRIRKVDTQGIITTVAGNGNGGFSGDGGPATLAKLNGPFETTVDRLGNIFISDTGNHRVRKVSASNGLISTVAGNGTPGYTGDGGIATATSLNQPSSIALDASGNFYIADAANNRIRNVTLTTGIITSIAGTGTAGYAGDGGAATNATLNSPAGVILDPLGNLYVTDYGNNRIRMVNLGPSAASATIPSSPQTVSAVSGVQQATLTFTAPASNGGAAIDSYTASCTAGSVTKTASGAASPLTVTGLTGGTAYSCSVYAHNAAGNGAASAAISVTPGSPVTLPTAPQAVSVASGIQLATLSFTAPASNGGAAIDSYTASCTAGGVTKTAGGASSPLTVTGLTGGTAYSCSVYAHNSAGNGSASTAVSVTPNSPITAPTAPLAVAVTAGVQQATLSFSVPASNGGAAIDAYTASCTAGGVTQTASGAGSPLTVSGLTGGTAYSCNVSAHNSAGNGPASTSVSVTPNSPITAPAAPQSVSVAPGIQQATLSFTAPDSNGGASIDTYTASCTAGGVTKTASGASSPLTVSGLNGGTAYSCNVFAHNSAGNGPASTSVGVTPNIAPSTTAEAVFFCAETLYSPIFNAKAVTSASPDGQYFMRSYPSGWILGITTDGIGFYFIPPNGSLTYLDTLINVNKAYCLPYGLGL